jgi:hypothetical protein
MPASPIFPISPKYTGVKKKKGNANNWKKPGEKSD